MSLVNNDGEFTFARSLVNPDKLVRDQTLLSVQNYIRNTKSMEEIDMLKLWKALYFCMWLSDKQEIQAELASSLSQLIDIFSTKFLSLLFIKMFFRTILREWALLDQYRVNKFYTLVRVMTNKSFELALGNGWNSTFSDELIRILESEVLSKRPNGIRFHIADIFLPELCKVTGGNLDSGVFVGLIQMFVRALLSADDITFSERITDAVFNKFINEFAGENILIDAAHPQFSVVTTLAVQKYIFDTAADDETPGPVRKRLYALHKAFAAKSGHAFIDDKIIRDNLETSIVQVKKAKVVEIVIPVAEVTKAEKRKKTKVTEAEVVMDVHVDDVEVPKKKSKRDAENYVHDASVKVAGDEKKLKPLKKESTKPSINIVEPTESAESKKKKKSDKVPADASSKPAVLPVSELGAPFLPSAKFVGSKRGYVFQQGPSGLGYYLDQKLNKKAQNSIGGKSGASKTNLGGNKR